MKWVVGVSIGSSTRDHKVEVDLLGERFLIERRGTDGDLGRAVAMIRELDGKADAIGLGGLDLYIFAGGRRYTFRDAKKLARAATSTPVVDGSGLKNTLERRVVKHLSDVEGIELAGKRVLLVVAVDRFGMAEELAAMGCRMVYGDLAFGLGIPISLQSLTSLARLARVVAPIVTQLPFKMLYPTGDKQLSSTPRFGRYFEEADIIAGDFHYIKRYMPDRLEGKGVITNTLTAENVAQFKERGVRFVVGTTPDMGGRSFGTNVLEAALVCVSGRRPESLTPQDYNALLDELDFHPRLERFDRAATTVVG